MGIIKTGVDVGTETPKEDYPWRAIKLDNHKLDPLMGADADSRTIIISNPSCLMGGLDVTAKIPVCGLGVPMILSEIDFVWLAVYFDTNLRPLHATICKAPRFTRWYEYGGISMGGFPRAIKTIRRDHIGLDIGPTDADGFLKPEPMGPEYDYIEHEVKKEVEFLSPYGFLHPAGAGNQPGAIDTLIKALRSEQTFFINDPIQVKQWAAYQLLGYCTSTAPNQKYPYPGIQCSKDLGGGKSLTFWYRQTATTHLMLSETNAGGVRAAHIVPGFSPYIEAIPHPNVVQSGIGAERLWIKPSDGVEGTLPKAVVDSGIPGPFLAGPLYRGGEIEIGQLKGLDKAPNCKARVCLPGENALPTTESAGVLGWQGAHLWYQKFGRDYSVLPPAPPASHDGKWRMIPNNQMVGGSWDVDMDCDSLIFYLTKERCMDSMLVKLQRKGKKIMYVQEIDGTAIDTGWVLP